MSKKTKKLSRDQKIDWFIRNCYSEFVGLEIYFNHPDVKKEELTFSQMSDLTESKIDKLKIEFDKFFN